MLDHMASPSPSCNDLAVRTNLASIANSPRYCYKLNDTRFAEFQHLPCEDYYVVSTLSNHPGGYKLCYIDDGKCQPSEWIYCADAPPAQPMSAPLPPPLLLSPTPLPPFPTPPALSPSTLQLPPPPPATPGATDEEPPKLGRENASLASALAADGHQNGGCGKGCIAAISGVLGTILCAIFVIIIFHKVVKRIIFFARRHQGVLKRDPVLRLPGSSNSYPVSVHGRRADPQGQPDHIHGESTTSNNKPSFSPL